MVDVNILLAALKRANQRPSKTLILGYKKAFLPILNTLVTQGFISTFYRVSTFLIITLKPPARESKVFGGFLHLSVPLRNGRKGAYTAKSISKLQHREGGSSCYLFSTDRGIITSFTASRLPLGGKPILKIN